MKEAKMKKYVLMLLSVLGISLQTYAGLTPVGSYTITFARDGWSESAKVPVNLMDSDTDSEDFTGFTLGGQTVQIYMESVDVDDVSQRFNWYIDSFAKSANMLGGTGGLTITISDLTFAESDTVEFMPYVTHVYYVNYSGGTYNPISIPGSREVVIGEDQLMRSPIQPYYDSYYGTPSGSTDSSGVTATLSDLYVPSGVNWEVCFGMGFLQTTPNTPEPFTLAIMGLGALAVMRKKC
jgi:hypothetical protein